MKRIALGCLFVLGVAAQAEAQTTRWVCAAGDATCGGTPAYTTLALALTPAVCGDTIKLLATETFTANTVVPNKGDCSANPITITTTATTGLPATNYRATPTDHAAAMPNLQSGTSSPALSFAASARGFTLKYLEFGPNPGGYNAIVEIGTPATSQEFESQQPQDIIVDSCLVRGDAIVGQKLGIDLNGKTLTVKNSWVDRIWATGQDSTAIRFINGTGPISITNNYIEGAAEGFLTGGADPQMATTADVAASPAPTTTSATLENFGGGPNEASPRGGHTIATLKVGQLIAISTTSNTLVRHTYVRSCGTSTVGAACTANAITFDAIPEVPSTGAASWVKWGAILNGVTFRRNLVAKPTSWSNPILNTPTSVTATTSTSSGTLASGTYYYKVVARRNSNVYNVVSSYSSLPSTEVSATLTASGTITISWAGDANATHYRVFRGTSSGGQTGYIEVAHVDAPSLTDSGGTALTTSAIPSATYRVLKNAFELKFGTNIQVDSNIFEYTTPSVAETTGYAIWLKANNQDGSCEFCQTKDVVIEKNIIRHVAGAFLILGRNPDYGNAGLPPPMENLTIRQNLIYDSNSTWLNGANGKYAFYFNNVTKNAVVDHNTWIHHMTGFVFFTSNPVDGLTITNNLGRHETYGVFGDGGTQGSNALAAYTVGGVYTFNGNVLAGANASQYPAGSNLYPTVADFETNHFTSYGSGVNGDYSLLTGSAWKATATDGTDRGANISTLMTAVNGVEAGSPEGSSFTPITITTTGLATATNGVAYSAQLQATTTTSPYTWSISSGSLPAWASLAASTGIISGTPNAIASTTFTVRVQDSQGTPQSDTQELTLTVVAAPVPLSVSTSSLSSGTVGAAYTATLAGAGGTAPYTAWAITAGSLPAGLTLASATGIISGVPTATGTSTFTVRVTDSVSATATRVLSLTIAAESTACASSELTSGGGSVSGIRDTRTAGLEAKVFRRVTSPVTTTPDCARVGDLWIDTSTAPPTLKRYTSSATWESVSGTAAHALFSSSHSDTTPLTPSADGCVPVTTSSGTWIPLCPGANGTYLQSTGSGVRWATASAANTEINADNITSGRLAGARGGNSVQRHSMVAGSVTTTDPPVGGRELGATSGAAFRGYRNRYDTEGVTQVALYGYQLVACAAGVLRLEYWTGSNWVVTGAEWNCTTTDLKEGTFVTLPSAARAQNTQFRMWYTSGDGVVDPVVTTVQIQFR